jgi:2-dehydropantoate 2-reductase
VYAGRLSAAGFRVQLLGRPDHVAAIEAQGGVRIDGDRPVLAPVPACSDAADVVPADVLILLTKTYDSQVALQSVDHVRAGLRLAVSLQNGIAKNASLTSWCGDGPVIGGASMVGGTLLGPGTVRETFAGPTVIGEVTGGSSPRVERFAAMLEHAGLVVDVADDIHSVEWSKVLQVLPAQSITALVRCYYHESMQTPVLARAFALLLREGAAVARADGAELLEWEGAMPLRAVADASFDEAVEVVRAYGRRITPGHGAGAKPSMLQSVERRMPLEVESLHGEIVRRALGHGVDVPAVATVYSLLGGVDELHRLELGRP